MMGLQEDLKFIDKKADNDISKIKRAGFQRRQNIYDKSKATKRFLQSNQTSNLLDQFINGSKRQKEWLDNPPTIILWGRITFTVVAFLVFILVITMAL